MHIQLTEDVMKKIDEMSRTSYWNAYLDKNLYAYILKGVNFPHPQELEEDSKEFQSSMSEHLYYYNDDESLMGSAIYSILNSVFEGSDDYMPAELIAMILRHSKIYHKEDCKEFNNDPFIKNIRLNGERVGDKSVNTFTMKPYSLFEYDESPCYNGLFIPRLAMSVQPLSCPCMNIDDGTQWDIVGPRVIRMMKPFIKNAKGDVLVLGSGLGYFPYMISSKKNVHSITIVDNDPDSLALFKEIILPQFPYKDKINIINEDPVAYLKKINDGDYDYCFADLWSWDESDSIYITTKTFCKKFYKMKVEYWLESDFFQTLISAFSEVIEIQYAEETGEELEFDSDYTEYEQFVVDFIESTLEDYVIDDIDAINVLTTPEKLSKFLSN